MQDSLRWDREDNSLWGGRGGMRRLAPASESFHRYGRAVTRCSTCGPWSMFLRVLHYVAPALAVAGSVDVAIDGRSHPISLHRHTPQPRHGAASSFVRCQTQASPPPLQARRRIGNLSFPTQTTESPGHYAGSRPIPRHCMHQTCLPLSALQRTWLSAAVSIVRCRGADAVLLCPLTRAGM